MCVYGDSYENNIVGFIVPNPLAIKTLAKKLGSRFESKSLHELFDDPDVNVEVLKELQSHAKRSGLHKSEIPVKIKLVKEEWTPDSGLVTAALKIRRKPIKEFYQQYIDAMYGRNSSEEEQRNNTRNIQSKPLADENGNHNHVVDNHSNKDTVHIKQNGSVSNGHIKSSELDVINENVPLIVTETSN